MPATSRLKTAKQVRADFDRQGISVAAWARDNGVPVTTVYQLLSGAKKARRGASHRAAVLLGMKHGDASGGGQ